VVKLTCKIKKGSLILLAIKQMTKAGSVMPIRTSYNDRRALSYELGRRPRGPKFALLIMIIMAILSLILALATLVFFT
jgi:hypothetical protein